jgi:hypothetical protein
MVSLPDIELPGTILATRYGLLNMCAKVNKYKYVMCLIAGMFLKATKIKKGSLCQVLHSVNNVTLGKLDTWGGPNGICRQKSLPSDRDGTGQTRP